MIPQAMLGLQSPAQPNRVIQSSALIVLLILAGTWAPLMADTPDPDSERSIVWVGREAGPCDFPSLEQALDEAAEGATIRLATDREYTNTPYNITRSVTLEGGWDTCQGSLLPGDQTTLDGEGDDRIMTVANPLADLDVTLQNLEFRDGTSPSFSGGLTVDGDHEVDIIQSRFTDNFAAEDGGGVLVSNGATVDFIGVNEIDGNLAEERGGGVHCEDDSQIRFRQGAAIHDNRAKRGGGLSADSCNIWFHSGDEDIWGIRDNTATRHSAGVLVSEESTLIMDGADPNFSDPELPVIIEGNVTLDGVTGGNPALGVVEDSSATLTNTIIRGNEANDDPNIIRVWESSEFVMRGDADAPCSSPDGQDGATTCSKIVGNIARGGPFSTGIVYSSLGTNIEFESTEIRDNEIIGDGPLIHMNSNATIENSLIAGNSVGADPDSHLIELGGPFSTVTIRWTTIANNQGEFGGDTLILLNPFTSNPDITAEVTLELEGLVIDQPGTKVVTTDGDEDDEAYLTRAACIIAPEVQTMQDNAEDSALIDTLEAGDPLLVDPDGGNYRLSADSPALDRCAASIEPPGLLPPETDIEGLERGIPNSADGEDTPFDLGAFERGVQFVFQDRFETD